MMQDERGWCLVARNVWNNEENHYHKEKFKNKDK